MKLNVKTALLTAAIVLAVAAVLFLTLSRKREGNHFALVPISASVVATVDPAQLWQKSGFGGSNIDLQKSLVQRLSASQDPLTMLLMMALEQPGKAGILSEKKGVAFLQVDSKASYFAACFGHEGKRSVSKLLDPLQKRGFSSEKIKDYNVLWNSSLLVAFNRTTLVILQVFKDDTGEGSKSLFTRLVDLKEQERFFPSHEASEHLLASGNDLSLWLDEDKAMELLTMQDIFPGNSQQYLAGLKGITLDVNFLEGSAELRIGLKKDSPATAGQAQSKDIELPEYHRGYHPSGNLLAFVSLASDAAAGGNQKEQLRDFIAYISDESGSLRGLAPEALISAFRGDVVLSVAHPEVQIGKLLAEALASNQEIENPLSLISPEIRVTATVDPEKYDSIVNIMRQEGLVAGSEIVRFAARIPYITSPSRSYVYIRRSGNVMLASNVQEEVAAMPQPGVSAAMTNSAQDALWKGHRNFFAHLDLAGMFNLFGSFSQTDENQSVLHLFRDMQVTADQQEIGMVITLKNKKENSLGLLLHSLLAVN